MSYLLNLVYLLLLAAASPWLLYTALRKRKYREGFAEKFLGRVPVTGAPKRQNAGPCLWFHAVSVGEVNLLGTILTEIRRQHPHWQCVVSTTTMTGHALARKKYADLTVFYCPLDFSWATRRAMRRIRPQLLVLAELELWPNLIGSARECGARVAVINGRLSQHSYQGYRRLGGLVASVLRRIDLVAVQDDQYATRFLALGARAECVHVTGSMKYDDAQTNRSNPLTTRLAQLAGFGSDDVVFLAGSTQDPEEALALAAYDQLRLQFPQLRLVLVPRHPERFAAVARLLEQSGLAWQRRSRLEQDRPDPRTRILLVDAVGELGAWWGTAQIAFVGGSLTRRGGQNMIEPAAYGAAVSFGPNTHNFRDIVASLLAHQAAVVVHNGNELTEFVRRCLEDPPYAQNLGEQAKSLVSGQLGATQRTLQHLAALVESVTSANHDGRAAA